MDWVKGQFDKLLLTFIVLFFTSVAIHATHGGETTLLEFAKDNAKLFAGALLTLITGRLWASRKPENGGSDVTKPINNPPDVPRSSTVSVPTT